MNLTFKQLRAFVMVSDLQSFRLAAERLCLTPGAVSLLIRDLEEQVGFSLFDRSSRRVSISRAGLDFLPAAQQVLQQVQAAAIVAGDAKNRATGVVRVASPPIVAHSILPQAIAAYRKVHPKVLIRPVDCTLDELVRTVEAGHADIAIGPDRPTPEQVRRLPLYESPWVLWCSREHPMARLRRVTWSMLAGETVIAAGRDYETHVAEALRAMPESGRFAPAYLVNSAMTALGMAASGLGITLSPMYVGIVARHLGLVMKPLDEPAVVREFSLYVPRHQTLAPGATAVAEFLADYLTRHRLNAGRRRPPRAGDGSRAPDP